MSLSRDQILAASDKKIIEIDVPEWGGSVHLRTASIREWEQTIQIARTGEEQIDGVKFAAAVLAACICDENGTKLFQPADIETIEGKSRVVVNRLFAKAQSLNGFGDEAQKQLEGNSGEASAASSSDSSEKSAA